MKVVLGCPHLNLRPTSGVPLRVKVQKKRLRVVRLVDQGCGAVQTPALNLDESSESGHKVLPACLRGYLTVLGRSSESA